jgi:UDP-4-amino-4,6-dideoxy-N-acetyl-beta-L-altrosamine N-acetyltransferase
MFYTIPYDLELDGLRLQHFSTLPDAELLEILAWRNHPDVRRWVYTQEEIPAEAHLSFCRRLAGHPNQAFWRVQAADTGTGLGVISFRGYDPYHRHAEFNLYLNPEQAGKGWGTRLGALEVQLAFEYLHLHCLRLEVFEPNTAAVRLYEKIGFQHTGRLPRYALLNSHPVDVLIMAHTGNSF